MRNALLGASILVVLWAVIAGCGGSGPDTSGADAGDTVASTGLGKPCSNPWGGWQKDGGYHEPDGGDGCDDKLQCLYAIGPDLMEGVCTNLCTHSTPCPGGSLCYTIDQNPTGWCAAICLSDADCQQINPKLKCLERSSALGRRICLSN